MLDALEIEERGKFKTCYCEPAGIDEFG